MCVLACRTNDGDCPGGIICAVPLLLYCTTAIDGWHVPIPNVSRKHPHRLKAKWHMNKTISTRADHHQLLKATVYNFPGPTQWVWESKRRFREKNASVYVCCCQRTDLVCFGTFFIACTNKVLNTWELWWDQTKQRTWGEHGDKMMQKN